MRYNAFEFLTGMTTPALNSCRAMEKRYLVWLITRRSQVQILLAHQGFDTLEQSEVTGIHSFLE